MLIAYQSHLPKIFPGSYLNLSIRLRARLGSINSMNDQYMVVLIIRVSCLNILTAHLILLD